MHYDFQNSKLPICSVNHAAYPPELFQLSVTHQDYPLCSGTHHDSALMSVSLIWILDSAGN